MPPWWHIDNERDRRTEMADQVALTVRMDSGLHDAIKSFATATESSVNSVVQRACADFVAGPGRREEVEAFFHRALAQFGSAVDKLPE
jgi:hypothetical protein